MNDDIINHVKELVEYALAYLEEHPDSASVIAGELADKLKSINNIYGNDYTGQIVDYHGEQLMLIRKSESGIVYYDLVRVRFEDYTHRNESVGTITQAKAMELLGVGHG
jgi:hypothetical protein